MSTSPIRGQTASQAARVRARRQARRTQASRSTGPEPDLGDITSPSRGQAPPPEQGTRDQRLELRRRVADEYETVEPEDVDIEADENRLEADLSPEAERDVAEAQIRDQLDADPSTYDVERISAYGGASPSGNYPGSNIQPQDRFIATRTQEAEPDIGPIDAELAENQPGDQPPTQRTRTDIGPGGPSQQSVGSVAGDVVAGTVSAAEATYDDPVGSAREAGEVAAETTRLEAGAEAAGEFGRETIQNEQGTIEDVTGTRTVFSEGLGAAEEATGVELGQRFTDASDYVAGGIESGAGDVADTTGDVIRGGADVTAEVATGGPLTSDSGFAGEVEQGIRGAGDVYAGGSEAIIRGTGRAGAGVARAPVDAAVLGNRATQAGTVALQSGADVDALDLEADVNVGRGASTARDIGEATAGYTGATVEQGASAVAENPVEAGTLGAVTLGGGYAAGTAARSVATRGTRAPEVDVVTSAGRGARAGARRAGSGIRRGASAVRERSPVGVEINPDAPTLAVADDLSGRAARSVTEPIRGAGQRARSAVPDVRGRATSATDRVADRVGETAGYTRLTTAGREYFPGQTVGDRIPSTPSLSRPSLPDRPSISRPDISRPDLSRPSIPEVSPPDVRGGVRAAGTRLQTVGEEIVGAPRRAGSRVAGEIGERTARTRVQQQILREQRLTGVPSDEPLINPSVSIGRPSVDVPDVGTRIRSAPERAAGFVGERAAEARVTQALARERRLSGVPADEPLIDPSISLGRPSVRSRVPDVRAAPGEAADLLGRRAASARLSQQARRAEQLEGVPSDAPLIDPSVGVGRVANLRDVTIRIGSAPETRRVDTGDFSDDVGAVRVADEPDTTGFDATDAASRADDAADDMLGTTRRSSDDGYVVAQEGDMLGPAARETFDTRQRAVAVTRRDVEAPSVRPPDSPGAGFFPTFPGDVATDFGGTGAGDVAGPIGEGTGTGVGAEDLLAVAEEPTVGTGATIASDESVESDDDILVPPGGGTDTVQGGVNLLAPDTDTGTGIGNREDTEPILGEVPEEAAEVTEPEAGQPGRPRTPLPELPDSSDPFGPSDDDGEGEGDIEEGFYLDLLGGG